MNRQRILAGLGPLGLLFGCSGPAPAAHRGTTTSATPRADAGSDATAATREAATSTGPASSSTAAVTSPPAAVDPVTTVTVTVPTVPRTTTTFTVPEKADDDLSDDEWWQSQPGFVPGACGGSLPPCSVMRRESGGDVHVYNRQGSGASGKWQFMPGTWAGYGGYANAADAPEWVQDEKARQVWAGGRGCFHWDAC